MGRIEAAAMVASKEPPELVLPRLRWVPWIGPLLARVLPPRVHRGVVLSYDEFRPFRAEWEDTWDRVAKGEELSEEEFEGVVVRFLRAQRLPVRPILSLPGSVLTEVLEDLFLCQTRANLPRAVGEVMERVIRERRTGKVSHGKGPERKRRRRPAQNQTRS